MEDHPYGWLSLLPPLIAILLAIITRKAVVSLVVGIFFGALITAGGNPVVAVGTTLETHLWPTLIDPGKMRVFAFTLLMGAMVGVIARSGAMQGLVNVLSRFARGRRSGQFTTWLLGLIVFFDDYTNTILLGSTLKGLCDRLKISRQKLAYLVDSTAAPVASLALLSTWIAVELEFIADGLEGVSGEPGTKPIELFIASIPYRFYAVMALLLVPMIALTGRDFGPMLKAERAAAQGKVDRLDVEDEEEPSVAHWANAVVPILVTLVVVVWLIYRTGSQSAGEASSLRDIVGSADSSLALQYGSLAGLITIAVLCRVQRLLDYSQVIESAAKGMRIVIPAIAILWCASALSKMTGNKSVTGDVNRVSVEIDGVVSVVDTNDSFTVAGYIIKTNDTTELRGDGRTEIVVGTYLHVEGFQDGNVVIATRVSNAASNEREENVVLDAFEYEDHRLYTAEYLADQVLPSADTPTNQSSMTIRLLPTAVFLLAAVLAFATGTSFGTMGILMPMTVSLTFALLQAVRGSVDPTDPILLTSVASVLSGAVFGDHCSPISDTTILSSQSSGCDHMAHVMTQLPYAFLVGGVTVLLGTLPIGWGISLWILLPVQLVALVVFLLVVGKK